MEAIDVTEASQRMATGEHVLLDVREPHEWAAGHAPGATHVPLGLLSQDVLDAGASYLVICRSGARSAQAVMALGNAGYTAVNVAGGMQHWAAAALPMESTTGEDPRVIAP